MKRGRLEEAKLPGEADGTREEEFRRQFMPQLSRASSIGVFTKLTAAKHGPKTESDDEQRDITSQQCKGLGSTTDLCVLGKVRTIRK